MEMMGRELSAAWKLVVKAMRERPEEVKVFTAARSFVELERVENKRRLAAAPRMD
jgi:hypothetical protein